ncbi:thrombomodulin [Ctenodactylus gundi]
MPGLLLVLGALAAAGLGLPTTPAPSPIGGQCVGRECYALFRGPATFPAARRACERLHGHLMTVRSSVAADAIALLLSDSSAGPRLWIGLELPPGCGGPGPRGPLRGFRWVTGDNQTSYSRWARPAAEGDGVPPCGPLCVAVERAPGPGDPAWEAQPCDTAAQGFLCELHFAAACQPLALPPGVASTYRTPFGASGADFQALPVGSSAAVDALGLRLRCAAPPGADEARWGRDAPGAWDCGVDNGGCEHACDPEAAGPRCRCPPDAALAPDGRACARQPLCPGLCAHFCVASAAAPGSYQCMCATGYRLAADGHSCEDVDDCAQEPRVCQQRCVNTEGGFDCLCDEGFEKVGSECVEAADPCFGADCEYQCQQEGATGYRCICAEGFAPVPGDPSRCQLFCNQTECPADCDPHVQNLCRCPEGYILDGESVCVDIDECEADVCGAASECRNLMGTYECLCGPGTALAGQVSQDCDPDPGVGATSTGLDVEEGGSGEAADGATPGPTSGPPARPAHSGLVIGTSVGSLSLVVALSALLCHLRKKQALARAGAEYKCAS